MANSRAYTFPSAYYTTRSAWKVSKPAVTKSNKSRRGPKAKSWTKEEELLLIEQRQHRIPYRRIAEQLHKTELACRLHYHQLIVVRPQNSTSTSPIIPFPDTPAPTSSYTTTSTRRRTSSPPSTAPTTYSTLPSLTRWLDAIRHQRSTSLPNPSTRRTSPPLRSRCTTPPQLDRSALFAIVTPPTPPTASPSRFSNPPNSGNSTLSTTSSYSRPASSVPSLTTSPTTTAASEVMTPSPTFSAAGDSRWGGPSSSTMWCEKPRQELWSAAASSAVRGSVVSTGATSLATSYGTEGLGVRHDVARRCSVWSLLNHDG